jgi:NAD(P)-dependent dehydrogenase (short-subunit alcohol dehydrogenase family)
MQLSRHPTSRQRHRDITDGAATPTDRRDDRLLRWPESRAAASSIWSASMNLDLTGKVAVVSGASKGIGLAITQSLVAEGVQVMAGAQHGSPELTDLVDRSSAEQELVDLTSADGPAQLVEAAVETFGGVDILVNNVGAVRPRLSGFLEIPDEEWIWSLTINFLAAVRITRAAVPHLLKRAPSTIVTVSSVNATLPDPSVIDYCAAKSALSNFGKALSKELGPQGIRVNSVSPGPVATGLWLGEDGVAATVARATGGGADDVAKAAAAQASTGRFTTPQEVADLVVLLASARAGNATGSDFLIDGGLVDTW